MYKLIGLLVIFVLGCTTPSVKPPNGHIVTLNDTSDLPSNQMAKFEKMRDKSFYKSTSVGQFHHVDTTKPITIELARGNKITIDKYEVRDQTITNGKGVIHVIYNKDDVLVVLTFYKHQKLLVGEVRNGLKHYSIEPIDDGWVLIGEVDDTKFPPCGTKE